MYKKVLFALTFRALKIKMLLAMAQQEKSRVSVPLIIMTFRREDLKAWTYARKVHVFEKNA